MCEFVSAVVTKDKLFFGSTDSHSEIIDYHKLHEYSELKGVNIVKLELIPDRLSDPISRWRFVVDQDMLPTWWDAEKYEKRMRYAVRQSGLKGADAKYHKVCNGADRKYDETRNAAYTKFEKIRKPAYEEFDKVRILEWKEFKKKRDVAYGKQKKVCEGLTRGSKVTAADEKCSQVLNAADKKRDKTTHSAKRVYDKIRSSAQVVYIDTRERARIVRNLVKGIANEEYIKTRKKIADKTW